MSSISAPAGGFDTGTAVLFAQTAAPVGWTKSTSHNNKALRVVSGTAGSGGSVGFTTAFASQAVTGGNSAASLSTAQLASHAHQQRRNTTAGGAAANMTAEDIYSASPINRSPTTAASGSGSTHNHTFTGAAIDLAVQYVDAIIATKD